MDRQLLEDTSSPNEESGMKVTVILAGKREMGKSTLINNILHLTEDNRAKTGSSGKPVTTEVTVYSNTIHLMKMLS